MFRGTSHVHLFLGALKREREWFNALRTSFFFFPQKRCPYNTCPSTPPLKGKMTIPLPLPHPVQIAMVAYNREAEEPIPLESEGCRNILKIIEESVRPTAPTEFVDVSLTPAESERSVLENRTHCPTTPGRLSNNSLDDSGNSPTTARSSPVVNLASAEDITLELEVDRVLYSHSSYGTPV